MTDFMDSTAAKIVLASQRDDSINRIADKIDTSYSWVYDWIERLVDANIISNTDNGVRVIDHEMRRHYDEIMGALYCREGISQEDAYVIPHFTGMEFAYTEIDAAYVWTHGGYQVARSHDDYPVFIEVHDRDVERWIAFFERYGIDTAMNERPAIGAVEGNIYYVLFPTTDGIKTEWISGNPVIPLSETVEQMMENRPAYEPALEIIADEYDVDIDVSHRDRMTAD
jgi:DNA-binding Lrp family transcriptional regulator